jgi:hypothetical protein
MGTVFHQENRRMDEFIACEQPLGAAAAILATNITFT